MSACGTGVSLLISVSIESIINPWDFSVTSKVEPDENPSYLNHTFASTDMPGRSR